MRLNASIASSGYGVNLTTDSLQISASITVSPDAAFPSVSGSLINELGVRIQDDRFQPLAPAKARLSFPHAQIKTEDGLALEQAPLSDWGYALTEPGRYRVSFILNPTTTNWAAAHGFRIDNSSSSELRVVKSYSDIDRHFFPSPVGWSSHGDICGPKLPRTISRVSYFNVPALARGRRLQSGDECFVVYLYKGSTIADGMRQEREIARDGNTLLSEDDDADCGHERASTFIYESRSKPYTHTEAVLLNMQSGYIVARYRRPSEAENNVAAEEAMDAPCKLL